MRRFCPKQFLINTCIVHVTLLRNLTLTGYTKGKRTKEKQQGAYLMSLCKWIPEYEQGELLRGQILPSTTSKLWRAMITHIMKRHEETNINKNFYWT